MELKELLRNIEVVKFFGVKDRIINDIKNNSREIKLNDLFIAIDGNTIDGHIFINDAIQNGSKSIVCQTIPEEIRNDITYVVVNNTRKVYSKICSNYFKNPSKKMYLIGITGTNGKTTTATLLYKIFNLYGYKVGLLSTNKILIDGKEFKTDLTTPDSYKLNLDSNKFLTLYNPSKNIPINCKISPKTKLVSLLISINKFHSLFSDSASSISFISDDNLNKKYYKEDSIPNKTLTVLNQILNENLNNNIKKIYFNGKVLELLSILYNTSNEFDLDQCPFLADDKNIAKIKRAKEIILQNIDNPPGLNELATKVEIPLKNLKTGFKQVYGNTVYGFLSEYKMTKASQMLSSKNYNVNEVSQHLGYSSASHFINAFKKRFGITPKKYLN